MNTLQVWSLILGTVAPIVISWIQQPKWKDWLRAIVTALFCLIVGFVNVWLNGDLGNATDWVSAVGIVFIAAVATFKGFWQATGLTQKMETATSPGNTPHNNLPAE